MPEFTAETAGMGTLRLLEAIRTATGRSASTRRVVERDVRQGRRDPAERDDAVPSAQPLRRRQGLRPLDDQNYREAYGLLACNGILFNHESPRRGATFVTRKVTRGDRARSWPARRTQALPRQPRRPARLGLRPRVRRGDVADAPAGRARTTTSSRPARCTRSASSSRGRVRLVGLDWQEYVRIDQRYFRPTEVDHLLGDASRRARARLGPDHPFRELVRIMLEADLRRRARSGRA